MALLSHTSGRATALGLPALLTAGLLGCSFSPADGQFTCPDGECPEGQRCGVDGICRAFDGDAGPRSDAGPRLDAGPRMDGAAADGGPDAGPGVDAGPNDGELCAPDPSGSSRDDDADGIIDEGCPWFLGQPHFLHELHAAPLPHAGLAFDG